MSSKEKTMELVKDPSSKKGLSLNILMLIAMLSLLAYHGGIRYGSLHEISFYDYPYILLAVNGIFLPLMAFAAVEIYHHTKSLPQFLLELLILGAVSCIPFLLAMHNPKLYHIPEVFGIILGLSAIHLRRSRAKVWVKVLVFPLLILISLLVGLGFPFLVFMMIFDYFYGNPRYQRAGVVILCVGIGTLELFTRPLQYIIYGEYPDLNSFWHTTIASLYQDAHALSYIIAIILLLFYRGNIGNQKLKWVFYIFYPLHLVLLLLLMPS